MIRGRRKSHCRDLDVIYNAARAFIEGMIMPFEFRVIPRTDGIENLFVEVRFGEQVVVRQELEEELEEGEEVAIDLPLSPWPELVGKVPFKIYVGYAVDGNEHRFLFRKTHTCFRRIERVGNVLRDLKIEMKDLVRGKFIIDPNLNLRIAGLEDLAPRPDDPAEAFRFVDLPAVWEEVALRRIGIPDPYDALTLVNGQKRIHVVAYPHLKLGRRRKDSTVLCRLRWEGEPSDEKNPNRLISRQHCVFELTSDDWMLRDGGWDQEQNAWKASGHGTYINGQRIGEGAATALPVDSAFTVSLGTPDPDAPGSVGFDARVWSDQQAQLYREHSDGRNPCLQGCVNGQSPVALVLRRRSGGDAYVALHGRMPLGAVDSSFAGLCLCRCTDGFLLSADGRHCGRLKPGREVRIGQTTLMVERFKSAAC